MEDFYAHGKLLLTGEYFVLDGAKALAFPTQKGQRVLVEPTGGKIISWFSRSEDRSIWFSAEYELPGFNTLETTDWALSERMMQIFRAMEELKPGIFHKEHGFRFTTFLEFPREWGLGTSSTLIYNLAEWAGISPFRLLAKTFGGSGYDIACAGSFGPIIYQLKESKPQWEQVIFEPSFLSKLFLVYLEKKQDSREGIAHYKAVAGKHPRIINDISQLTEATLKAGTLEDFIKIMEEHEKLVAGVLNLERAADISFPDFEGVVKSLGAWGGDFVLVTNPYDTVSELRNYFFKKGFKTVTSFKKMALLEEPKNRMPED